MAIVNLILSVVTLNVNGLEPLNERQGQQNPRIQ